MNLVVGILHYEVYAHKDINVSTSCLLLKPPLAGSVESAPLDSSKT